MRGCPGRSEVRSTREVHTRTSVGVVANVGWLTTDGLRRSGFVTEGVGSRESQTPFIEGGPC